MEKEKLWIAAFDIGKKNFAFAVQEFDSKIAQIIKNDKKHGIQFSELANKIFSSGKLKLLENYVYFYQTLDIKLF